jgi:RimJ/RimL family protein N-acetyltransferase
MSRRPHLADTPVIETARLILRAPSPADWPHWRSFAASERARFVGGPLDEGRAWRAFGHVAGMWALLGFGSFIFEPRGGGEPLGMAGPWRPADWPEAEIGWTIWSEFAEGRGYAFEAAAAARDFAFTTLGWSTAVSYIDPENVRSIRLAERLGARADPDATPVSPECLVYRHPAPEGRA